MQRIASLFVASMLGLAACSSVSTVRLQPEAIDTGKGTRPIAGIQANAISFYFLFIPIPGVDLDQVVNQMLVVTAKTMGADKVTNLEFDVTPNGGVWALRKLLGWRSASARGIAVQLESLPPDPNASDGPEAPVPADNANTQSPGAPPSTAPAPGE